MRPETTTEAVTGLSAAPVDPLRYDSQDANPHESSGLLMAMIPEGARVLDVGCGTGSISAMIRDRRRATVVGIEPHPARAEAARGRGLEVVTGLYSEAIPREHGVFDVVLFADVLEHMEDPARALQSVKPALAAGGRVLASIPNVAHWSVRLRLLGGAFDYAPHGIMDATHLRWFTRRSVRRLFDGAGYEIDAFRAAAGSWLEVYRRTPLGLLSPWRRSVVLAGLCRAAPGLVAVQHVVSARPRQG